MSEQKKAEEFGITEDDVSEIRQDINKFRFELVEILRKNRFDIGSAGRSDGYCGGRRAKQMERRILKGFNVDIHDLVKDAFAKQDNSKTVDIFKVMAEAINKNSKTHQTAGHLDHCRQYSSATIAAANRFKRPLAHHHGQQSNGRRTEENGPASKVARGRGLLAGEGAGGKEARGRGLLANEGAGGKEALNVQMLNTVVIPCSITLNGPAGGREEEAEEEPEEEAGVLWPGQNTTCSSSLQTTVQPAGSKLTTVRRSNQVTSGWI